MQHNEESEQNSGDEKILEIARKRFALAEEAEADIRRDALDDLKFSAGDQWHPADKAQREREGRPCLTINRLPQFIRQITNDQRQNRPAIKVSPVDDKADVETAKIYQGIIRHIENSSNADTAYDVAFDSAVRAGFGYFRVVTEFASPFSFEQVIRIKAVPDRFAVRLDPSFRELDGSDSDWGFIEEKLSREEFNGQYPESEITENGEWASIGDGIENWITSDSVRVTEYFYRDFRDATIVLLADAEGRQQTIEESELPKPPAVLPKGFQIIGKRQTQLPVVKWCKLNGAKILERTEWPGRWIPIIPVLGEQLIIEGKRTLSSIVRHAKDSMRMYNYWKTCETETITLAPKAPWIADYKTIEAFKDLWATANTRSHSYLPFDSANGTRPAPQRNAFEPPVQAITQASMLAADDLKATTGVFDAAMGNQSNETSGIAIQRRNIQSQTSNFHFIDNLSKSIRHCGRILVDLIPKIYDTERAIRILGEDGKEEIVQINREFTRNGQQVRYDLGVGEYDVTVSTGPSFETRRQEAVASMMDFAKAMPQHAAVIADIIAGNMDWSQSQEISERLRKTLPPGMADDKGNKQVPPEIQAQMGQMNQMVEALTQQLNAANQKLETKAIELESRERIEMAKIQAQIEMKLADLGSKEGIILLEQEVAEIQGRLAQLNFNQPIESEADAGPMGQPSFENQMPTGGPAPGEYMGDQP